MYRELFVERCRNRSRARLKTSRIASFSAFNKLPDARSRVRAAVDLVVHQVDVVVAQNDMECWHEPGRTWK
jgi:hypothetical protein